MVWFGLVWFGLVWFGLVWFGLVWFGLVDNGEQTEARMMMMFDYCHALTRTWVFERGWYY